MKKNNCFVLVMLAVLLVFGFIGCDKGKSPSSDPVIALEYRRTYDRNQNDGTSGLHEENDDEQCDVAIIVGERTVSWSGPDANGKIDNVSTSGGGIFNNGGWVGSWIYIYVNGVKRGFASTATKSFEGFPFYNVGTESYFWIGYTENIAYNILQKFNPAYNISIDLANIAEKYPGVMASLWLEE